MDGNGTAWSPKAHEYGIVTKRCWLRAVRNEIRRTVDRHERLECPVFGVTVLPVVVRSTQRPGLEVSPVFQFWVIGYLGAPLVE
jgi:hypothetical protein